MSALIATLDYALAKAGADATLRRIGGTAPSTTNYDVTVRVRIDSPSIEELLAGIAMSVSNVIMSPSEIAAASWPASADGSLPRRNDRLIIDGRTRVIEQVDPKYIGGELVRIELKVSG